VANELNVLSTTAMKSTIDAVGPQFEAAHGTKLSITYAPSVRLAGQLAEGLTGDVAVITGPQLDALVARGQIAAGSRIDIACSRIGLAVQAGAARPDISTADAFRRAMLAAKSVGTSNPVGGGQSGAYLKELFERLGIAEAMQPKLLFGPGGPQGLIGLFLKRGEVEVGLQQMPELMAVPGIDIVGPLPDDIQSITVFSVGTLSGSAQADEARRFADFMRAPAVQAVLREMGMESPPA
jgi:molybdate transport system substrate-binding protein